MNLDLDETHIERALGILWDKNQDVLKVKAVNKEVSDTKRGNFKFRQFKIRPVRNFISITDRTRAN